MYWNESRSDMSLALSDRLMYGKSPHDKSNLILMTLINNFLWCAILPHRVSKVFFYFDIPLPRRDY